MNARSFLKSNWCKALPLLVALATGNVCLGQDAQDSSSAAPKTGSTNTVTLEDNTATNESTTPQPETSPDDSPSSTGVRRGPMVVIGRNAELKAGDTAEAVVVIGGSAKVRGKVRESVVAILGNVDVDSEVRHSVVSILGNIKAGPNADLRDAIVSVAGDIDVLGSVRRQAVAVLGDVRAEKGAHIHEATAVGGRVEMLDGATVDRQPVELDFGGLSVGLRQWLRHCVFKLRPLAPQVGWVWGIAGFFFLIYLVIALLLPGVVRACVIEITRRPVATFFMGLLTKLLVPVVFSVLAVTGIGLVVVPFVLIALIFGAWIGKTALFESLGIGLGKRFGASALERPILGFLAGVFAITLLYMVPVIGLLTLGLVAVWGLGGAVMAAFGGLRREPVAAVPGSSTAAPLATMPASDSTTMPVGSAAALPLNPSVPAGLPEAYSHPRATFWERAGAAFLDIVLVGILGLFTHFPPFAFLIAIAYFTGMWTWKGTTVGGAVLGLKVVRQDGQPVTFLVALVRSLASAFSVIVFFLGFLWIGWDKEKQGWHDKIAGTVVLRLPRAMPLVCL